jgi:hypothetical protein
MGGGGGGGTGGWSHRRVVLPPVGRGSLAWQPGWAAHATQGCAAGRACAGQAGCCRCSMSWQASRVQPSQAGAGAGARCCRLGARGPGCGPHRGQDQAGEGHQHAGGPGRGHEGVALGGAGNGAQHGGGVCLRGAGGQGGAACWVLGAQVWCACRSMRGGGGPGSARGTSGGLGGLQQPAARWQRCRQRQRVCGGAGSGADLCPRWRVSACPNTMRARPLPLPLRPRWPCRACWIRATRPSACWPGQNTGQGGRGGLHSPGQPLQPRWPRLPRRQPPAWRSVLPPGALRWRGRPGWPWRTRLPCVQRAWLQGARETRWTIEAAM